MKLTAKLLLLGILLCIPSFAANFDTISGSKVQDTSGALLASGQICFLGTDNNNRPISYQAGGGGQVTNRPACASVTSGVIGVLQVADSNNTTPAGVYYEVTVTDLNSGQTVLHYKGVQVTVNPFNFDTYAPTCSGCSLVPPTTTAVPGNFNVNGNLTVVGSCTGCSASNPFYQTVQENGVSATQRSTTNYNTGVVASDVGGKTQVDLAAQIAGGSVVVNDVQASALTVTQANAGALGATTYYIRVACNFPWSLGPPGTEQTFAASASNVITVTSPTTNQCGGATAPSGVVTSAATWNVYVSNTAGGGSGTETLQASGIAIGTNWTEPTSGLVSGATMLSAYTFDANYGNVQRVVITENITASSLVNAQSGVLMSFLVTQSATGGFTFAWPSTFANWKPDVSVVPSSTTALIGAAGDATNVNRPVALNGEHVVSFSATPTFDFNLGNLQKITLTANVTSETLSNFMPGAIYVFEICQDGTGGRTFAWTGGLVKNPPSINAAANACTVETYSTDYVFGTGVSFRNIAAPSYGAQLNTVTFSATPVFDAFLGAQLITLTGNVTSSTFINGVAGLSTSFDICQDATGSRTFVWPTNMKGTMTIGSTASKCNVQSFVFDGVNWYANAAGLTNQ